MKFLQKLLKVLTFFRVVESEVLSLTNIAMMVILWRVCMIKNLDLPHGIALLTCLMSYQGKRFISGYFAQRGDMDDTGSSGGIVDDPDKK